MCTKTFFVSLLDGLLLTDLLEAIGFRLVLQDADGIKKEVRRMARRKFIVIIMDDLKGRLATCFDSLVFR